MAVHHDSLHLFDGLAVWSDKSLLDYAHQFDKLLRLCLRTWPKIGVGNFLRRREKIHSARSRSDYLHNIIFTLRAMTFCC